MCATRKLAGEMRVLARYSVFLEICLSSREFCLVCCTAVHVLASLVHILLLAIALSTTLSDMSDIYFIRVSLSGCAVLTSINALGLPSRTCINLQWINIA